MTDDTPYDESMWLELQECFIPEVLQEQFCRCCVDAVARQVYGSRLEVRRGADNSVDGRKSDIFISLMN